MTLRLVPDTFADTASLLTYAKLENRSIAARGDISIVDASLKQVNGVKKVLYGPFRTASLTIEVIWVDSLSWTSSAYTGELCDRVSIWHNIPEAELGRHELRHRMAVEKHHGSETAR